MPTLATEGRTSWICRSPDERRCLLELHDRLVPANTLITIALAVAIVVSTPPTGEWNALVPAGFGVGLYATVQRSAHRFQRPELWIFASLLLSETMTALALVMVGEGSSSALAMLAWTVTGLAGRFHRRAALLGTLYTLAVAAGAALAEDPRTLQEDPLPLALTLVGIFGAAMVVGVFRDSDVRHRSAANVDELTGLQSRSALIARIRELERVGALTREHMGVVVVDLDRFKAINDTFGHATGDAVLQQVAGVLRRQLRSIDVGYRLGGDEFVFVLPGADPSVALRRAEDLRAAVAAAPILGLDVRTSAGATASRAGEPFVWTVRYAEADERLYRAKGRGGDRAEGHVDAATSPPTDGGTWPAAGAPAARTGEAVGAA